MPTSKHPQPKVDEWEFYRKEIRQQFIVNHKTKEELSVYMFERYGFRRKPRDYEYRLRKWNYRRNITMAQRQQIQREIDQRKEQKKPYEVIYAGRRLSSDRILPRTQLPTLIGKFPHLETPQSSNRMDIVPSGARTPPIQVQTPPFLRQEGSWPSNLPWLRFNERFEELRPELPLRSLSTVKFEHRDILTRDKSSIQRLSRSMDILCPEVHDGDHVPSAEIIVTGSHQAASLELLKLFIYFLSNNMTEDLYTLADESGILIDDEFMDPLEVLRKSGILTKGNIEWLMGASDETSDALLDVLLRESLINDDAEVLHWMLGKRISIEHLVCLHTLQTGSPFSHASEMIFKRNQIGYTFGPIKNQTLLQAAVYKGSIHCSQVLLDAGADPNTRANGKGYFPLEYTALHWSSEKATNLFELLLDKGADLDQCLKLASEASFLSLAIDKKRLWLVERLLQHGTRISPIAFEIAAHVDDNAEMLRLLHDNRKNWTHPTLESPTIWDMLGPSALREAINNRNTETMEFLLRINMDPNGFVNGMTHLEFACRPSPLGHPMIEEVKILLRYGALIDWPWDTYEYPDGAHSALQIAAINDLSDVVRILLDAGADVNFCRQLYFGNTNMIPFITRGGDRRRALHQALEHSSVKSAKVILQYKPQLLGFELQLAAGLGDLQLIEMLFEAGAQLMGDELSIAFESRNAGVTEWFLRQGLRYADGTSTLEVALLTRNFEIIWNSLPHAAYDSKSLFEATSLAIQMEQYVPVVELLVSKKTAAIRNELEVAALVIAIFNRNPRLRNILSHPKFLPGTWKLGFKSYGKNSREYIKQSPEGKFEIHPSTSRSSDSRLPYVASATYGMHILDFAAYFEEKFNVDYAVTELIELGAYTGDLDLLHLFWYTKLSDSTLRQIIQARGKTDNLSMETQTRATSLVVYAIKSRPGLVNTLLEMGVSVNKTSGYFLSRTPLQLAVEDCNVDLMKLLQKTGADVNAAPCYDSGATCLQIASIKGYIGIARKLLDLGALVNAPRARLHGRTAIEGAAENGRLDMIKLLLSHLQDDPELRTRIQFIRAVKFASQRGHNAIVKILKEYIQWNQSDQERYGHINVEQHDVVDEMTQELPPDEVSLFKLKQPPSKIYESNAQFGDTRDHSSGFLGDSCDDESNDKSDGTDLNQEQGVDCGIPMTVQIATDNLPMSLGSIPRSAVMELDIEEPHQQNSYSYLEIDTENGLGGNRVDELPQDMDVDVDESENTLGNDLPYMLSYGEFASINNEETYQENYWNFSTPTTGTLGSGLDIPFQGVFIDNGSEELQQPSDWPFPIPTTYADNFSSGGFSMMDQDVSMGIDVEETMYGLETEF